MKGREYWLTLVDKWSKRYSIYPSTKAAKFYQDNQDAYFTLLKKNWLREAKMGVTKSSKLTRSDFKSKYGDLIVLLNRIMGTPQGMQFKSRMYYFIDEIVNGK